MSSRNQNKPPRSPSMKKEGIDEIPDKRRKIGTVRVAGVGNRVRGRQALSAVDPEQNSTDLISNASSDVGGVIQFTKDEIQALLNEKLKGKKFDLKGKLEQMTEHIKKLRLCIKWLQDVEEGHVVEMEKLQITLQTAEKKLADMEVEMKNKEEEQGVLIAGLRTDYAMLQEKFRKEESDKLDAIECHKREKEARDAAEKKQASLLEELKKAQQEQQTAIQKFSSLETMYNNLQEYNKSLQQYNSKLQTDLGVANETGKRIEKEKAVIVENLSGLRGHCNSLQEQLNLCKASQGEVVKQKETLAKEVGCLREELQRVRDDRDSQILQLQALTDEVKKYKESIGKSFTELDSLTSKSNALEEICSSQREQLRILEHQLASANEKLKMSDLSSLDARIEFEEQKRLVKELREHLADSEHQISEGEKLRKKLHNTILELKGNIRVFCRVRPMISDGSSATESASILEENSLVSLLAGQKLSFTFDKVFNHEASQEDVFVEISQLVQSALDGYKVCIFAYGQTGSGKTYTMIGRPEALGQKGLIPRSLEQIFQTSLSLSSQGWKYKMQASMLEIYNETIRDLLSVNRASGLDMTRAENGVSGKQYTITHDANGNTHVADLTIVDVCDTREVSSLLRQAAQSRSDQIPLTSSTEQQVQGVLNLIDLAGSERLSKSGATGDRLKETQAINKSLSSLSDVISALAKKEPHIPFRNSKLTHLLQPCLGGDSKTLMFVNISPEPSSVGESLCSLRFAAKVNACEIGVPRRQTSMRPPDSRLSYG
ncbi:Spindle pole body-associated protein Vik1/Cik1, microtubule binding domain [Dillenia turbinata]|uniref:Kinesin-like protein n=1 Tax=Dillenia turbinata TaxID=194707 RepID=A0AAN8VF93_9MAGN